MHIAHMSLLTDKIHKYISNKHTLNTELYFFTKRWVASPPSSSTILACQLSARNED